jgi:hypothetical protein
MKEKLMKLIKENKIKVVIYTVVIVLLASLSTAYGLGVFKTPEPKQEHKQTEVKQDKKTSVKEDKKSDNKKHDDKKSDSKETSKTDEPKNIDNTTSNTVTPTENNTTSTTTNNTSTSNNTSNSTPAPTPCVPTYTTVTHPEQGHYEQHEIMPAYDRPIYEQRPVGGTTGHVYNSIEDFRSQAYSNNPVDGAYSMQNVQVGTEHVPAEYDQVWVIDQPAYTTTEASGC